jgi:hypothetical protein
MAIWDSVVVRGWKGEHRPKQLGTLEACVICALFLKLKKDPRKAAFFGLKV